MSLEARRVYDEKTRVHQEVMGAIEALTRAQKRNQRVLSALDQRIAAAGSAETADGLKQERTRVAVQNETLAAELEARKAEYQDLPRTPLEFMPVTIEVAVTETESEKKAQLAIADIIGKNGALVGSTVGNAASGLFSKSVAVDDLKTEPDAADSAGGLERARAGYFDALVEVESSPSGKSTAESQRNLAIMKGKVQRSPAFAGTGAIEMMLTRCIIVRRPCHGVVDRQHPDCRCAARGVHGRSIGPAN